ncbi:hypothetical protein [Terrimonas alba]|uniref:hypothetical protein n=1 Tax=Terrimonas alba TaxID=3349636 RepID=UPI0035F36AE0
MKNTMTDHSFFIIIIFLSVTLSVAGQKSINASSKKLVERNREPIEINIDTFLGLWLQNTADPREPRLKELKMDSAYTYFTRNRNYYKINNEQLRKLGYKGLIGDSITKSFYYGVIPLVDREREKRCSTALIDFDYKYKYKEEVEAIEVSCHYKVTCELVIPVVKKKYVALYDLKSKSFLK